MREPSACSPGKVIQRRGVCRTDFGEFATHILVHGGERETMNTMGSMMARHQCIGAALLCAVCSAGVTGGFVIDGTKDGGYGPALALQTVQTGFGDNDNELNAGYAVISGGYLHIMITGNLESNFNQLEIFLDSKAGGQTVYDGIGTPGLKLDGLKFDAGFTADYHLWARRGIDGMANAMFNLDIVDLAAQSGTAYTDIMGGTQGSGQTGTGVNADPILVGYNDNNVAGVLGGTDAANQAAAAAVTTGFEMAIKLSDIGYAGGPINIMVGINGSNHDYWSNQFLGGLPTNMMNGVPAGTGNLGGDGTGIFTGVAPIDFTAIAGLQYFTLVPAPGTLALLALGLPAVRSRRRRGSSRP